MPAAAATAAAEDDGQVGFSCDRGYEYVLHLPSAHAVMQVRLVGVSMWHRAGLPAAPQQGTRCGAAPITRCAVCILRQPANGFSISPCARGAQAVTSAAGADPFCDAGFRGCDLSTAGLERALENRFCGNMYPCLSCDGHAGSIRLHAW